MNIINLTPHEINFIHGDEIVSIPASGTVARLTSKTVVTGEIMGIPVTETVYGEVTGLPDEDGENIYVVSALVAAQCKNRFDVFIPNESVRDENGRIVGCRSLGRI